jgi:hypothetical protein
MGILGASRFGLARREVAKTYVREAHSEQLSRACDKYEWADAFFPSLRLRVLQPCLQGCPQTATYPPDKALMENADCPCYETRKEESRP